MSEPRPGFLGVRRQAVVPDTRTWVRTETGDGTLPLRVHRRADTTLATWAAASRDTVDEWLGEHGAVLFTGFEVTLDRLPAVTEALAGTPLPYRERSTPRTQLADGVYTSTEYPADQTIPLHNENSYQQTYPARLVFCCLRAPETGGKTPLADCRRVLRRLPHAVVAKFRDLGVRYVRNFHDSLGLPWTEAFQTDDRAAVEQYCAEHGIRAGWRPDGGLRTEQDRPALTRHPVTGDEVWFNHAAFFHVTSLPPDVARGLTDRFAPEDLPTNTCYGDGTPIEDDTLAMIRAAYDAEKHTAPWTQGDLLLVDNVLVAHGREPFTGQRSIAVSMAGALSHTDAGHG
ncbi:TauD/TfdA family dioxygenase [Actinokineospora guangxiensis]|uniref:TauD/TfdA family dioxygenase n=1 Tax=Actinokineospora guangxiensis TaxID=1490288 RepID=A0ABW0ER86_9PSEU